MMKIRLLTTCISIAIGASSLLVHTSAMSTTINENGIEHGYGIALDTPFETNQEGMPTTINAWLEGNNLGNNADHEPDLPDQVPDNTPDGVPRNTPDIPDHDIPDHDDGMGAVLRDLLNTDEPDADELRSVIESWQEDHQIGSFNTHTDSEDTIADELTSSSATFTASSLTISAEPVISVSAVPVPAAVWLFGSGIIGLIAVARRK